jgi:hypothetical protein
LVVFLLWRLHTSKISLKVIPLVEESIIFKGDSTLNAESSLQNIIGDSTIDSKYNPETPLEDEIP